MVEYLSLFVAAYLTAAISGAAGFGGALLLLPLLVSSIGVSQAIPLLTIAQLIGNFSRAGFGFKQIQWQPVGLFLLGAVPLSIVGAHAFVNLPELIATRAIGVAIFAFVTLKHFNILTFKNNRVLLVVGGGLVGFLSGLVGSAGPLGAAIFLSLGLPPVAYIASEAVTALVMHSVKTVIYQGFIEFERGFWLLAVLMGGAMVLGTWSAKRIVERLPSETFQQLVTLLLLAVSGYMVVHG
ncbi:sulfite exporter TauE/SafE family protein [Methylobacter sp. S3L5C]|uniref:sulfite exporter TauE/SafE family protein n=1 Tax=Methylobacter sp. S3L5C TaxID=2839024 RepID=UPI001FAE1AAD|nr:sulfite exporter TauE/SafE family protein [Methylobacter sp. S3L5C]UOA08450.1 sulfite exporter TauE/SafE family protein [Methylobacter sp. S3L5C]